MARPAPFVPSARAPVAPTLENPVFDSSASATTPDPRVQNALIHLALRIEEGRDDAKEVQSLIAQGADVNAVDDTGRTPLHVMAWKNRPTLVMALLNAGARATARDQDGADALIELLHNLSDAPPAKGLIARLVAAGANPNGYAWNGWTRFAKENLGDDLPLNDGLWLNELANERPLPLDRLPEKDEATRAMLQTTMTRVIVSAFKLWRIQRMTPLAHALRLNQGSETVVEELLAVGADPLLPVGFGATSTLFHEMTSTTPVALIDRFLDLGVPAETLNGHGKTPLQTWHEQGQGMAAHAQRLALRLEQRQLRRAINDVGPANEPHRGRPRL